MQKIIVVANLQSLTNPHAQDTRRVKTAPLVNRGGSLGSWSGRKRAFQPDENIGQASIDGCLDGLLDDLLSFIHVRTLRILAHPDDGIAWQSSAQMNVSLYRAACGLQDWRGASAPHLQGCSRKNNCEQRNRESLHKQPPLM
jgi:hypothetical protein